MIHFILDSIEMLRKVLASVPGFKPPGSGVFFYPKGGFGRISEKLYDAAKSAGADFSLGTRITSLHLNGNAVEEISSCSSDGQAVVYRPDYVWSTIPVTELVQLLYPPPPSSIVEASQRIEYRAMIFVYLVLG